MTKYRMNPLRNLEDHKKDVLEGTIRQIKKTPEKKRKNWSPIFIGGVASLIALFLFFVMNSTSEDSELANSNSGDFYLTEFGLNPLKPRQNYHIITGLDWTGNQPITIKKILLVEEDSTLVSYENAGIDYEVFGADPDKTTGLYGDENIGEYVDLENLNVKPNEPAKIIFKLRVKEDLSKNDNLRVKLVYELNGKTIETMIEWHTLTSLESESFNLEQYNDILQLTAKEEEIYEVYKKTKNQNVLSELEPKSIARLYLLATIEGDYSLQYEFYTNREDFIAWSREDHLNTAEIYRSNLEDDLQLFSELSKGEFVQTEDGRGYISFTTTESKEEAAFQLIQNDNGIWQVAFMPVQ